MNELSNYEVMDTIRKNYLNYCSHSAIELYKIFKAHPPIFNPCLFDWKNKIIFIQISKCASSTMRVVLENNNFCQWDHDSSPKLSNINGIKNYFIENDYKFYAIIREPKSRYISGLKEFIEMYNPPLDFIISNLKNNKFIFDDHTAPQNCFLSLCNDKCNYLKMDEDLSDKVSEIIGNNIMLPKKNVSPKSIKLKCKDLFEQYCEKNIEFYKLYNKDFELYNISI
jgi:hypothetical protein